MLNSQGIFVGGGHLSGGFSARGVFVQAVYNVLIPFV